MPAMKIHNHWIGRFVCPESLTKTQATKSRKCTMLILHYIPVSRATKIFMNYKLYGHVLIQTYESCKLTEYTSSINVAIKKFECSKKLTYEIVDGIAMNALAKMHQ